MREQALLLLLNRDRGWSRDWNCQPCLIPLLDFDLLLSINLSVVRAHTPLADGGVVVLRPNVVGGVVARSEFPL